MKLSGSWGKKPKKNKPNQSIKKKGGGEGEEKEIKKDKKPPQKTPKQQLKVQQVLSLPGPAPAS